MKKTIYLKSCNYVSFEVLKWIGGPYYNETLEICQFLDCIMHLLFLRVVKTTKGVITELINRNKKRTPITL